MALLTKEDIKYLLANTDFDEFDIREWFREFLKVSLRINVKLKLTQLTVHRTVLKDTSP